MRYWHLSPVIVIEVIQSRYHFPTLSPLHLYVEFDLVLVLLVLRECLEFCYKTARVLQAVCKILRHHSTFIPPDLVESRVFTCSQYGGHWNFHSTCSFTKGSVTPMRMCKKLAQVVIVIISNSAIVGSLCSMNVNSVVMFPTWTTPWCRLTSPALPGRNCIKGKWNRGWFNVIF